MANNWRNGQISHNNVGYCEKSTSDKGGDNSCRFCLEEKICILEHAENKCKWRIVINEKLRHLDDKTKKSRTMLKILYIADNVIRLHFKTGGGGGLDSIQDCVNVLSRNFFGYTTQSNEKRITAVIILLELSGG